MNGSDMKAWMDRQQAREADPEWVAKKQQAIAEQKAIEAIQRRFRFQDGVRSSGVPVRTWDFLRKSPKDLTGEALTAIDCEWEILALCGPVGCGKTVAACKWLIDGIWLESELKDGSTDPMANAGHFVSGAGLARWNRYDAEAMEIPLRAKRLVIDDLGNEFVDEKGSYLALLNEIIGSRYDNKLPTVITTNIVGDTFRLRYGDRIADRLNEHHSFVNLSAPSYRQAP